MKYAIEHAELGRLLMPLRKRKCNCCGHIMEGLQRKRWTSDINEALLFDDRQSAEAHRDKVYRMDNGPRRRPKVIEIGS